MLGLPPELLVACVIAASVYTAAPHIKHGLTKVGHGLVHVVTLGRK